MLMFLRSLAFPVACAVVGAASGLYVVAAMAPSPDSLQAIATEHRAVRRELEQLNAKLDAAAKPGRLVAATEVVRMHESRFTLARALRQRLVDQPSQVLGDLRVIPSLSGGVLRGIKVYAIRPGSVAKQLGLRNGDLVVRVAGPVGTRAWQAATTTAAGPEGPFVAAQRALFQALEAGMVTLEVERKGVRMQLHIDVV